MQERYLEITYRHGKPMAAYLYLPRHENDKSRRVVEEGHGLMVDLTEDSRPIGIEILSPQHVSLATINVILQSTPCLHSMCRSWRHSRSWRRR